MILSWQLRAAAGAIALLAAAYGGWWLRDLQARAADGARAEAELAATQRMGDLANAVAARTETAIQRIRIQNRTIYNEVQREIKDNPVYRDCVLPTAGVQLIRRARSADASAGKPTH